jgi:hypothetical protein
MQQRHAYIGIAKALTAPLLDAYGEMININTRHRPTHLLNADQPLPLYDHLPQDTHTELPLTDPDHPEHSAALAERIQELELTFEQVDTDDKSMPGLSLHRARATIRQNAYDISDAATLIVNVVDSDPSSTVDAARTF